MLRKQIYGLLLALSLLTGAAGSRLWVDCEQACTQSIYPRPVSEQAWWGGLYPEYCLPGARQLVTEKGTAGKSVRESGADLPVKICFKYLTFLNHKGENHE